MNLAKYYIDIKPIKQKHWFNIVLNEIEDTERQRKWVIESLLYLRLWLAGGKSTHPHTISQHTQTHIYLGLDRHRHSYTWG